MKCDVVCCLGENNSSSTVIFHAVDDFSLTFDELKMKNDVYSNLAMLNHDCIYSNRYDQSSSYAIVHIHLYHTLLLKVCAVSNLCI